MHRSTLLLISLTAAVPWSGCVQYTPRAVTIESSAVSLPEAPSGPLEFDDAVRLLVRRNPDLKATRAAIAAVNTSPGPRPLVAGMEVVDGRAGETRIGTDILSLLGLGPRKHETAMRRAMRDERIRRHHELARDLVADLAEAYAVELALRELPSPKTDLDVSAFEAAGLASESILAAARAVVAEGDAEARVIAALLRDARREVVRLVGAAPGAGVEPIGADASWPVVKEADRNRLVLARGDLQRLLANWMVADKAYRFAVSRQIPNVGLALGGNVTLDVPMQLIRLELPLDAPAEARARDQARTVAFHELEGGVLGALHDAVSARLDLDAAEARRDGAKERRIGANALLSAERALLETDPRALDRVVFVAGRAVDSARQFREAAVRAARARVRAARAAGWPTPEMVGDDR